MGTGETVNIRPGVSVLSVLRHLNYRPWFALAEFVDNSIQSFMSNREELRRLHGGQFVLRVDIELDQTDGGRLVIRDNAGGIPERDYPRAFRPAQLPPDRTGLAEFGMGMKSAACWFAPSWQVRTSALGEGVQRTVRFDIERIVNDEIEELDVAVTEARAEDHFTEIQLLALHNTPVGRTVGKIKEHLADIYRMYTREGLVVLRFNGEELLYVEPDVLIAPEYDEDNEAVGDPREWRVTLDDFDFGEGLRARGFAALRREGSTKYAGFSLFRRNRLIEGSGDEKYRPQAIFGMPNDFVYQRLFGELSLEGFEVSHTKDGFRWDENEDPFLELLKERLAGLIRQARNYRARPARRALRQAAESASNRTGRSLEERGSDALESAAEESNDVEPPGELPEVELASRRVVDLEFEDRRWRLVLELSDDPAVGDWLELSDSVIAGEESDGRELLGLRMSLTHPFMQRFAGADRERIEPVLRVAAALGLAEKVARDSGVRQAGAIRMKLNKILTLALSRV
ncbi:MAG: ATP-binding protein [Phycisphaerales bacterium]